MSNEAGLPLSLWSGPLSPWGPLVTDELVVQAEQRLGVTLPRAYVDALRECNGGLLRRCYLILDDSSDYPYNRVIGVSELLGIGGKRGTDVITPALICFGECPAGCVVLDHAMYYTFLLDYRTNGPKGDPGVIMLHGNYDEGERDEYRLAPSFNDFIARLIPDIDHYDLGLTGCYEPEDLVSILEPFGTVSQRSNERPIYTVDLDGLPNFYHEGPAGMLICYNDGIYHEYAEFSVLVRLTTAPEDAWQVIELVRDLIHTRYHEQCILIFAPTRLPE